MAQPGYNPYAAPQGPDFSFASPASSSMFVRAERGTRFLAKLIDGLCDLAAAAPGLIIFLIGMSSNEEIAIILGAIVMFFGLLAMAGYQWFGIVKTGQTVGKRTMKIKVVRQDGSPVDFLYGVVLRNWIIAFASQIVSAIGADAI